MFLNVIDRIRLLFHKDKESYSNFYSILGFYPHNIEFYEHALLHKSSSKKVGKGKPINNERLEFLGDAILDAVVGDIVFKHFPGKKEGFLTNTRSKLVQRDTLNKIAVKIGLDKLVKSSTHSISHNSYMNGNAFEALIGAIYLDRGYDYCMWFMQNKILNVYLNIDKVAYKEVNFKSKLLEWSQKNRVNVSFELVSQSTDSANSPKFTSRILIEGLESGEGEGYSKKESQQIAAKVALTRLKQEPQFIDAVFAEKSKRTAMEEEPTELVPDTGTDADDFAADEPKDTKPASKQKAKQINSVDDEMSLDNIHVSTKEMSREDIIAAAEAAAFADNK